MEAEGGDGFEGFLLAGEGGVFIGFEDDEESFFFFGGEADCFAKVLGFDELAVDLPRGSAGAGAEEDDDGGFVFEGLALEIRGGEVDFDEGFAGEGSADGDEGEEEAEKVQSGKEEKESGLVWEAEFKLHFSWSWSGGGGWRRRIGR